MSVEIENRRNICVLFWKMISFINKDYCSFFPFFITWLKIVGLGAQISTSLPMCKVGMPNTWVSFPSFYGQLEMAIVGAQKPRGAIIVGKKNML